MKLFDKLFGNKKAEEKVSTVVETRPDTVYSPLAGTVMPLSEIPDEVFASGALGSGCGIEPAEYHVSASFDGTVNMVADTKHAIGLISKDGIQILIHVGLDTVALNGKGFDVKTAVGKEVKCGQLLMNFDGNAIQKAGYKITTAVIIANTDDYESVELNKTGQTKVSDALLVVKK